MAVGRSTSLQGSGGLEPYVYSVLPGGAGGSINPDTGIYTAPLVTDDDPSKATDTIVVTDDNADTAEFSMLITDPLGLVCDIIQNQMDLDDGRVYLWDQKIFEPTDSGLFVAVGVLKAKPFANNISPDAGGSGISGVGSVNVMATLTIDAISRSYEAVRRKEEILLALGSLYSQAQQQANSFSIGRLPAAGQFINLSSVDGAAIPYRFQIEVNVQYFVTNLKAVPYFDDFNNPPTPVTES
jgi:hypothetical protein